MKERHYLQWHITHACNKRCIHCYQEDYDSFMPLDRCMEALDQYCAMISRRHLEGQINLTGGEPLLHPDFFALAGAIRQRGLRLGILTNGTLIDDETAARLAALHPIFVQVSLDGTREIHDRIRGEGSFDEALAGIDALKRQGLRVLVSFTAQKGNITSFEALAQICRSHRVDKLWWDRVVTDTPEDTAALALSTEEFERMVRLTARLQRESGQLSARPLAVSRGSSERSPGAVCVSRGNLFTTREFGKKPSVVKSGQERLSVIPARLRGWLQSSGRSMGGPGRFPDRQGAFMEISSGRALQSLDGEGACYRCSAGRNLLILLADGSLMPCRRLPFVIGNLFTEEQESGQDGQGVSIAGGDVTEAGETAPAEAAIGDVTEAGETAAAEAAIGEVTEAGISVLTPAAEQEISDAAVSMTVMERIISGSPLMRQLARPRFPEGCFGCNRFERCRGGSRCVTYAQTGSLERRDVNCYLYPQEQP